MSGGPLAYEASGANANRLPCNVPSKTMPSAIAGDWNDVPLGSAYCHSILPVDASKAESSWPR
jgi:hypothetical protein